MSSWPSSTCSRAGAPRPLPPTPRRSPISPPVAALLPEDCWERRHELTFALELHRAECEFLTGALAAAEERLIDAVEPAPASTWTSPPSAMLARGSVHDPRSERRAPLPSVSTTSGTSGRRVVAAPDRRGGRGENTSGSGSRLGTRSIEELVDLPLMTDPSIAARPWMFSPRSCRPALFTDANLLCLVICRMVESQPRARQQRRLVLRLCHGWACIAGRISAITGPGFASVSSAMNWSNSAG